MMELGLLEMLAAGGDLGTLGVVFVYLKHSGALSELKVKLEYIEKYLITNGSNTNG